MRAVCLDHHRATGRQCRRGVATGHRECEREITGAEHRHRPQCDMPLAQIRARQWRALRQCGVDAGLQPAAFAHHVGEQTQLANGASALAFQTRARQAAFAHGAFDQGIAQRQNLLGDGFQKNRARFQRRFAIGVERRLRQRAGLLQILCAHRAERRLQCRAAGRIHRMKFRPGAAHAALPDQRFALEGVHQRRPPISCLSCANSSSLRSANGVRTGPAGRPTARMPALTMDTA